MADVFISYAREDWQRAERLAHVLEAAGCSVWWDREIPHGTDWSALIEAELARAKAVVVIWSSFSVKSGFVRDEAFQGIERGALVPVLFDGVEPPIGYRSVQAITLADVDGHIVHLGLRELIERITSSVGIAAHEPPARAMRPDPVGRKLGPLGVLAAGAGAVIQAIRSLGRRTAYERLTAFPRWLGYAIILGLAYLLLAGFTVVDLPG